MASQPTHDSSAPYVPGASGGARQRRTRVSDWVVWWREIDRKLLLLVLSLMAIGTLAVASSSPASARRLSTAKVKLDDLYFLSLIHI